MGFLSRIFQRSGRNRGIRPQDFFKMFAGYSPAFTTAPESLYEMELVRAAIHSFASFCSLLKPEIHGVALEHMERQWQTNINPIMETSKFLYRLATVLSVDNNAFIIPVVGRNGATIGFYPLMPINCNVAEESGVLWLRYTFPNGQRAAIELERAGILTQHQYRDDLFGDSNNALKTTMQMIHTNTEGVMSGIKSSAQIRFLAKIANVFDPDVIEEERKRFSETNLSADNKSGMLIYDNKFEDVKQVFNKPITIDTAMMKQIAENVYQYFGTNEAILQNKFDEEGFNAYFEGKIAPFANQLSLVLTNMAYTRREIAFGNEIRLTVNRLQYVSHKTKLQLSTTGFDRGLLSRNEIREMWGQPKVDDQDADKFFIRKEYTRMEDLGKELNAHGANNGNAGGTGGAHDEIKIGEVLARIFKLVDKGEITEDEAYELLNRLMFRECRR